MCIEILRGRNPALKSQIASKQLQDLTLCTIVWAELHYGAKLMRDAEAERANLSNQFGHLTKLPFNQEAAVCYGEIRAHLKNAGQMIGANDMLIAATAQAYRLTLVTHNTDEFKRIPNLSIEDWQV